jgi:hypothetical protein
MLSTKSFFKVAAGKVHIFWGRKHFVATNLALAATTMVTWLQEGEPDH